MNNNNKRYRVAFVMFHSNPQVYSGGPQVLTNLLAGIDTDQYQPFVITNNSNSRMTREIQSLGFEPHIVSMGAAAGQRKLFDKSRLFQIKSLVDILKFNFKMLKYLKSRKIQCIWVRNVKIVLFIGFAAKLLRIPLVWDIGMEKPSKGAMYYIHYLGFLLSHKVVAEAMAVFGHAFDERLIKRFNYKIGAVRSSINQDRIDKIHEYRKQQISIKNNEDHQTNDTFKILFAGSLIDRKNPLFLLKGIKELLNRKIFNFKLTIIGSETMEPQYVDQLHNYVNDNNMQEYVDLLGWRDNIPEYMAESDILVITSRNEGVPYTLLESMYAKLPVLGSDVGGIPEIITHKVNGLIYKEGDLEDFLRQITLIMTEHGLREELAKNALNYVSQNHYPEKWVKSQEKMFAELIKNNN